MQIKRNQQGFSHIHIILLIILAILIGLAGWRVWATRADKAQPAPAAPAAATKEAPAVEVTYVQPASAGYQVALPDGWVSGTCPDSTDALFLAPTTDKLGKCDSESGGTVFISRNDGNTGYEADYYAGSPYYGEPTYTAMTVDGIAGYKVSYSVATDDGLGYPPIGTEIIQYVFFDGTDTYTVTYSQFASDSDFSVQAQAIAESFDRL